MQQIQTKIVKKLILKDSPWNDEGTYGHTIIFTDGFKGEIYDCKEAIPPIKEGDSIIFKTAPNRFPDKPYIIIIPTESKSTNSENSQFIPENNNLHTSIVKEFILKTYPAGKYYSHRITFENGIQGELSRCTEKNPPWLIKGKTLTFSLKEGKKSDMPFIVLAEETYNIPTVYVRNNSQKTFEKNNTNNNNKYKSSRLDDDPEYWLIRQKCISITTCLDRANEATIAGIIDMDKRYEMALQDFNFILEYSGINENHILKEEFKKLNFLKEKKSKKEKLNSQSALFNQEERI